MAEIVDDGGVEIVDDSEEREAAIEDGVWAWGGIGDPDEERERPDDDDEDLGEKAANAALAAISKEWVRDPSETAETMRWRNTETGEYRYQEEKPGEGEGEGDWEEEGAAEGEEEERPTREIGDYEVADVLDVRNLEEGDEVMYDGEVYDVEQAGIDDAGRPVVVLDTEGEIPTVVSQRDLDGEVVGEALDTGDYEPESEFGRELANSLTTGEMNEQGADGFMNVRDLQHNISEVEDTELLADALIHELENRNSKTAVDKVFKARLRALGEDPEQMLEKLGYGEIEGPEDGGDYPAEGYDNGREHYERMLSGSTPDNIGFNSIRYGGIPDREEWEVFARKASIEDIEGIMKQRAKESWMESMRAMLPEEEWEDFEQMSPEEIEEEFPDQWSSHMDPQYEGHLGGLLYYREDSDVSFRDVMEVDMKDPPDELEFTEDEMVEYFEEATNQLDPVVGAFVMEKIPSITGEADLGPADKSWNGVHRGSGSIGISSLEAVSGSPNTPAHELGHALHYLYGITGGGDWGPNDWGKPNDFQVNRPAGGTGTREAREFGQELEEQWERYQASQLDEEVWDTIDRVQDLEMGETYRVDGDLVGEFVGQDEDFLQFEDEATGEILEYPPVYASEGAIERQIEESDVQQIRSYSAKGGHEFFTTAFAAWASDRAKLEHRHEAMAELFDEYFGTGEGGVESRGVDPSELESGTEYEVDIDLEEEDSYRGTVEITDDYVVIYPNDPEWEQFIPHDEVEDLEVLE